jgi:hypothetical protein
MDRTKPWMEGAHGPQDPRYVQQLFDGDVYLGRYEEYDLYFLEQTNLPATLVARYGSAGSAYQSYNVTLLGLPDPQDSPPWIWIAYARAHWLKLIGELDQ